jgi:hypothetical protein
MRLSLHAWINRRVLCPKKNDWFQSTFFWGYGTHTIKRHKGLKVLFHFLLKRKEKAKILTACLVASCHGTCWVRCPWFGWNVNPYETRTRRKELLYTVCDWQSITTCTHPR